MKYKPNNDFYGWAKTNSLTADIIVNIDKSIDKWNTQSLESGVYDYYYYAICPIHSWTVKFYNEGQLFVTDKIPHESIISGPSVAPWKDDSNLDSDANYGPSYTYRILGYSRNANATTPMDLSTFPITEDIELHTIWDSTPVSVYDNIHPEYFTEVRTMSYNEPGSGVTTYDINDGVVIGLKTAVKGKITIPAVFDGKPVVGIDPSFGASTSASSYDSVINITPNWRGKRYGANITHIFFQKAENNMTNVRQIDPLTFYNTLNLKYFEFAEGIRVIGKNAFLFVQEIFETPSLTSSNIGGTILRIEEGGFRRAFAPSVTSIDIGSSVQEIGKNGFGRYDGSGVINVSIGTQDAPSELQLSLSNAPAFNFGSDPVNVQFYTRNTQYTLDSNYIMNNFVNNMIVETPLLS